MLSVAQDSVMRDKRRALGRLLANAADETGTKVDGELADARVVADLDAIHVRVLRIMSEAPRHLQGADFPAWPARGVPSAMDCLVVDLP